jgi:hypothetical protein
VAASTTPFTEPANVLTAIPLLAMLVALAVRWPLRTESPERIPGQHRYRLWVIVFGVFVAWELYNYLAPGSRADHPTFSSMTDAVDRYYGLKVLLFLTWLVVGWLIVGSGSQRRPVQAS